MEASSLDHPSTMLESIVGKRGEIEISGVRNCLVELVQKLYLIAVVSLIFFILKVNLGHSNNNHDVFATYSILTVA